MNTLDRREFLHAVSRYGAGACCACAFGGLGSESTAADGSVPWIREIDFYERLPDKRIQCFVCPLHCVLEDGAGLEVIDYKTDQVAGERLTERVEA